MKRKRLPKFDSIAELAKFWQHHDLNDFEQDLEEVAEDVFVRDDKKPTGPTLQLELTRGETQSLRKLAKAKGLPTQELVRRWVRQKLARNGSGRTKRNG